jgi:2OG-Fe(II) oxygenase superfamily
MIRTTGDKPFRWWQLDDWATPIDLRQLPEDDDPCWEARYDNDCEKGKKTTRAMLPPYDAHLKILQSDVAIDAWTCELGYALYSDPFMHGGGLHITEPGGWLNVHLDYDLHPLVPGRRRAFNFLCFLNPSWSSDWGGALVLCDALGNVHKRVYPAPGRLFAFEVSDQSYHGVEPITGPYRRVTVACYLLSSATGKETRQRALFMPHRRKS